jgi:hypothetical protein
VGNVEELSSKLCNVWFSTYKLRINRARFDREGGNGPAQDNHLDGGHVVNDTKIRDGRSFKVALAGDSLGPGKKVVESVYVEKGKAMVVKPKFVEHSALVLEPELEFLYALECGYVGRLVTGANDKNVQLNLCLEGIRGVRAACFGEGRVLLFSESGEDVGMAISKRVWWEGLLTDLQPWSPNMVTNKRESWLRIYGFPLQVWGEKAFSLFTKPWGQFIGLDEETRRRSRLDVARVKISTLSSEVIDSTMFVKVQDVKYAVRVIEEGGGPLEFVHYTNEEDQIGRSMVESSCDSVEIGPAAAMVDEGLSDGFDSDGSEQQEGAGTLKTVHDNRVDLSLLKSNTMEPFDNTVSATPIPSNGSEYKTKGEDNMVQVEGEESTMVRGMSTSPGDDQGRGVDLGMSADSDVGQSKVGLQEKSILQSNGPVLSSPHPGPVVSEGGSGQGGLELHRRVGQISNNLVCAGIGSMMGEKLDAVWMKTRGKTTERHNIVEKQVDSLLSSSISKSVVKKHASKAVASQRKLPARLPFPQFGGPKCIRFAEAVNGGGVINKKKKLGTGSLVEVSRSRVESVACSMPVIEQGEVIESGTQQIVTSPGSPVAIQLEVVLPIDRNRSQQSGLKLLMAEEDLNDVDEFVVKRRSPEAKRLEVEELLQIQKDLGTSFDLREQNITARMIDHEDRDREKFEECEEPMGFQ